jgi:putative hemolysin
MSIGWILILIFILILVNGFFAASEMALVSLNKSRMKTLADNGNKKAKLVIKVVKDSTRYLSTIQVAITLAGFMSSALAGARLSLNLVVFASSIGISLNQNLAVVLITLILSYVTLVLGELVPKKLALSNPNKFSLFAIRPVYIIMIVTKPFVWLLSFSTKLVLKLFGKNYKQFKDSITEEEIRQLIILGQLQGLYKDQERQMLENIFRFDDLTVDMIKTQRTKVYGVDINLPKDEMLKQIVKSKFSRVIIYNHDFDHIIGIVHVKDILSFIIDKNIEKLDIKALIREPFYVPNGMKVNKLFKDMQSTNNQFALLVDEHGGFEGIVTIEDMLEEIVGEIYDEHDKLPEHIKKITKNSYIISGDLPIHEVNRYLNINIEEHTDIYHTLSGFFIYLLGYVPTKKDENECVYNNIILKINEMDETFIKKIELRILSKKDKGI